MTILTRERLDLRYETWRLHYIEGLSYAEIGEMQGRGRSTASKDGRAYALAHMSRQEREEYEAFDYQRRSDRKKDGLQRKARVDPALRCERCGILRDNGRIEGVENPNTDALCDACHVLLAAGVRHTNGELSGERLEALGYGMAIAMQEA